MKSCLKTFELYPHYHGLGMKPRRQNIIDPDSSEELVSLWQSLVKNVLKNDYSF